MNLPNTTPSKPHVKSVRRTRWINGRRMDGVGSPFELSDLDTPLASPVTTIPPVHKPWTGLWSALFFAAGLFGIGYIIYGYIYGR